MEENKFWLRLWGIIAMVFMVGIGSCTFSMHDKRDKWEKAVSNGADPMVASCALFEQTGADQVTCLLLAQYRK